MKVATLCYIESEGKTLMLHRVKKKNDMHKGKWNGLGGKIEDGESPEDCVIREIKEESGLDIESPLLKGVLTFPRFDGVNTWYVFVYTATKFTGTLIDSNEGDLKWIENEKLLELNLWGGDKIFLKWIKEEKFFSGKFIYKDGGLKSYEVSFY